MSGWLSDKGWAVNLGSPGPIGNVTPSTGKFTTLTATQDVVIATAGKGIDFSAVTPAPGMTSQLLADYEEGTWTPVMSSASGSITSYTVNAAKYTKIGRLVTVNFDITITNNGTGAVAINISGLPFNAASAYSSAGTFVEVAAVGFGGFINQNNVAAISLTKYDWTYPGGTNNRLVGLLTYNS